MKNFWFNLMVLILVFSGCNTIQNRDQQQETPTEVYPLTLRNVLGSERHDQPVLITRSTLESLYGPISEGTIPLLNDSTGQVIPAQADDMDQDGSWDELAFVYDFPATSTIDIQISFVAPSAIPAFTDRTNVRFGVKQPDEKYIDVTYEKRPDDHTKANPTIGYQMEGPAWENDLVAFRTYFDPRNGYDIFGKKTSRMVLDSVGLVGNYHELQDWGMDILKVNNSLGAGAIGVMMEDKIERLGKTDSAKYQLIAEGPIRSVFNLIYEGWELDEEKINATNQISIWAGQRNYQSEVTLSGFEGEKVLVTGIVNILSDSLIYMDHNEGYVTIATHAPQAFLGEYLGMAIMVQKADLIVTGEAPDSGPGVTETYYVNLYARSGIPVPFYFYSAWEYENPEFRNVDSFVEYLEKEAEFRNNPIEVVNPNPGT